MHVLFCFLQLVHKKWHFLFHNYIIIWETGYKNCFENVTHLFLTICCWNCLSISYIKISQFFTDREKDHLRSKCAHNVKWFWQPWFMIGCPSKTKGLYVRWVGLLWSHLEKWEAWDGHVMDIHSQWGHTETPPLTSSDGTLAMFNMSIYLCNSM